MRKTKSFLKIWVIALAMFFGIALAVGVTAAAYNTQRQADGTMYMGGGIVLDYSGFGKTSGEWEQEAVSTFKLFTDNSFEPGATIPLNAAAIKKGTGSIDFYTRIKFEYKFYDALNADVTADIADYSAFLSTPTLNSAWVDGNNNDGWFYYATGTTLNALPASYVDIFASSQSISIALNAEGFNHQGGGYKYSSSITITKVEAILTVETVQIAGSTWEINPLIQNSSNQVIEIQSNQITLGNVGGAYKLGTGEAGSLNYDAITLGNTLKIIVAGDSQINANAFANNTQLENVYIGDTDYISGASSYSAKIYTSETPTFTIGANAFADCTNLNVYLSGSCNYEIYASSLAGVNNVYYDGVLNNSLKSPSVGAVAGTTITVSANPSIVTGGTGAGTINQVSSSNGEYTYEDASGNIWYFDLGQLSIDVAPWDNLEYFSFSKTNNGRQVQIRYCAMSDKSNSNQSLVIPKTVSSSELFGYINVVDINGYHSQSELGTGCGNEFLSHYNLVSCITIPDSVLNIKNGSFDGCSELTSITIPNSVINIESYAFSYCTSLTSINISDSVKIISERAFGNCTQLSSVTIPNALTYLSKETFYDCSNLETFNGGGSKYQVSFDSRCVVENDGNSHRLILFAKKGLTSYAIPNIVTSINGAFAYCNNLSSIVIPDSVTSIGEWAFQNCTGLTAITIPDSVTSIGGYAFSGCTGLTQVTIDSSTITALDSSDSYLLNYATTVYVLEGLTVGDYIDTWGHTTESDKAGYVKYVKNS